MIVAKAALLEGPGKPFRVQQVELDEPRGTEVLVRIVGCGLCHTDLGVQSGRAPSAFPALLGHEGSGVVDAVGPDVTMVSIGDHVVLQSYSCGRCPRCITGHPGHCRLWLRHNVLEGVRPDGSAPVHRGGEPVRAHFFGQSSLATYALADQRTAVPVRRDADLRLLGPLGCSVTTGAMAVLNVLRPSPGDTLVVSGVGAVGLCAVVAGAGLTGATVIAVDVQPARLELAADLGAAHVVDARDADPVAAVRELTRGEGADFVLETSGVDGAVARAVRSLAPLGTCGIISAGGAGAQATLPILPLIADGLRVIGIQQGEVVAQHAVPALLDLHMAGRLPFDRLVRTYPLADVEQAAADARSGETVKPIILMD